MAVKVYTESTLGTSEIFKQINSVDEGGVNTQQKAIDLIKTAKHLTVNDIEAAYIAVKQVTDTLTRKALSDFDNEKTILIYNEDPEKSVTRTLPFITFNMKDGYKTFVFIKTHITMNRSGVMTLQPAILRDLLISATISTGIRSDYSKLSTNVYLRNILAELYTQFMTRIINREYAVQSDRIAFESIRYWIKKFFMLRIFGSNDSPDSIEDSITKDFKYLEKLQLEDIRNVYNSINPVAISGLFEVLKNASPRMKTINPGRFYSDWSNYYGVSSVLALDNIEYLIYMIISLQSGNNVISIAASDIVKECKGIKGLREELLKLV